MSSVIVLDTDTASHVTRGTPSALRNFSLAAGERLVISSITETELRKGALLKGSTQLWESLEQFMELIEIVDFDSKAARQAARVLVALRTLGKSNGDLDSLIAGHALSLDAVLVTNNTRHFENVPGLVIDNWVAAAD
jgi:tRNA(fMet)-specific endonuclease VapC